MGLADRVIRALLGISTYEARRPAAGPSDKVVAEIRENLGGNIVPLPQSQTRWYLAQLESAIHTADTGDMSEAARLCRAMRGDGVLSGVLSTRTDGLVRLPKRFFGDSEQVKELEPRNGTRSVFDEMIPPGELALLAGDGMLLGVGLGEFVPVGGRDYPVLVRQEPEFLRYHWVEGRWYFQSVAGLLPITPGDGRWVLHVPGGRLAPWQHGAWRALGRAWINKEHAIMHRSNYSSKLANPARAATAPLGATEAERIGFLQKLIAWGINTCFELPVGWDVKLIESNGRGFQVFQDEITSSELEYIICLAGQIVTTTGGTGFANADIHKSIRADLIKATADALAYTINTQCIPPWVAQRWGIDNLDQRAIVEWDVTPPKDRQAEAQSLVAVGQALVQLRAALNPYGLDVDVRSLAIQYGIPIAGDTDGDATPDTPVQLPSAPMTEEETTDAA